MMTVHNVIALYNYVSLYTHISVGCVPSEGLCGWVPNESINGVDPATSISERSDYINDILNSTVNCKFF